MALFHAIDPHGDIDLLLQQKVALQRDVRFHVPSPPASLNYKRPTTLLPNPFEKNAKKKKKAIRESIFIPEPVPEPERESAPVAGLTGSDESTERALNPEHNTPDVAENHVTSTSNAPRVKIRVSSKHLMLASSYFKHSLGSGLAESCTLQSEGHLELPMDGQGLQETLIVMNIIHNRNRQVPLKVSLNTLTKIAVLVDYLECHEAIEPFPTGGLRSCR
jgi:hypothetical protein